MIGLDYVEGKFVLIEMPGCYGPTLSAVAEPPAYSIKIKGGVDGRDLS